MDDALESEVSTRTVSTDGVAGEQWGWLVPEGVVVVTVWADGEITARIES